eukprot:m.152057 g.152057  ORF g.152057 m.152057 type:complete len:806 (+) comp10159_c3_seq3:2678-5095(+)
MSASSSRKSSGAPPGTPHSHGLSQLDDVASSSGSGADEGPRRRRATWQRPSKTSLEESHDALSMFKMFQAGRVGDTSMEFHGDALRSCIDSLDELTSGSGGVRPDLELGTDVPQTAIMGGKRDVAGAQSRVPSESLTNADVHPEEAFGLPRLPRGRSLTLNIHSTWGDLHYVGLSGIEVFNAEGELVVDAQIAADPADLNVLADYKNDPRTAAKLLDGVNRTCDQLHMWLAPFCPGTDHFVYLDFDRPQTIAMIRIWNYNESRIHSYRGARQVTMHLDQQCIFEGEIARAPGTLNPDDENGFGELLLFTDDEAVLNTIAQNDPIFAIIDELSRPASALLPAEREPRPNTGTAATPLGHLPLELPFVPDESVLESPGAGQGGMCCGRVLQLNFETTWGDPHYLGLTGLEVRDANGDAVPLDMSMLEATPRDINDMEHCSGDPRTLDKLINGCNVTVDDTNMWMIPFTPNGDHFLTIDFGREVSLSALCIWNYNRQPEDTYRGAQTVRVSLDDVEISPPNGFIVRRAPGHAGFDFGQTISLLHEQECVREDALLYVAGHKAPSGTAGSVLDRVLPEYVMPIAPVGFVLTMRILSTCGDRFYVGLNGLELFAPNGEPIPVPSSAVSAAPASINILEGVQGDCRTPDKLVDGTNCTYDDRHMWLAPFTAGAANELFIVFDAAVALGGIRLWNYSKTPQRGVCRFQVLFDDHLLFDGAMKAAPGSGAHAAAPFNTSVDDFHQTVLFTADAAVLKLEQTRVVRFQEQASTVQLVDEGQFLTKGDVAPPSPAAPASRPKTTVTGRPTGDLRG